MLLRHQYHPLATVLQPPFLVCLTSNVASASHQSRTFPHVTSSSSVHSHSSWNSRIEYDVAAKFTRALHSHSCHHNISSAPGNTASAASASPSPSHSPDTTSVSKTSSDTTAAPDELETLLRTYFPLDEMEFVATYGSAAFTQLTEEESKARDMKGTTATSTIPSPPPPPPSPSITDEPMLDLIFAVPDPLAFHLANIKRNPTHYSSIRFAPQSFLHAVQEYGAGVWYNTLVRLEIPNAAENSSQQTKLVKYGVISTSRLIEDLTHWKSLYIAGRMHKPMKILRCSQEIQQAADANLDSALRTAVLLIEGLEKQKRNTASTSSTAASSTTSSTASSTPLASSSAAASSLSTLNFSLHSLLTCVASLSYSGDIRMRFAENPQKVNKIVYGNWHDLIELYTQHIEGVLNVRVEKESAMKQQVAIQFDDTMRRVMIRELPSEVRAHLNRIVPSSTSTPSSISTLPPDQLHRHLSDALAEIVRSSSKQQTMKGLLTAGFRKSIQYAWAKVQKAMR